MNLGHDTLGYPPTKDDGRLWRGASNIGSFRVTTLANTEQEALQLTHDIRDKHITGIGFTLCIRYCSRESKPREKQRYILEDVLTPNIQ